jgi:hypothetical protein
VVKLIRFVDGVFLNAQNPRTFEIPSEVEKASVEPGHHIKAGVLVGLGDKYPEAERFWLEVISNDTVKRVVTGRIDNDLVLTVGHGLQCDNVIEVPYNAVLATMP